METTSVPQSASRFSSSDAYRGYQQRIAREGLLPLLAATGISLSGKRLLDVGCGTGGMTTVWRSEGARAVGMDIDASRLVGLPSGFLAGDVTRLPFRDGAFDLVFAHDCIEHVPDLGAALSEIARVLADDGRAFITFPPFYSAYGGHQQGSRSWVKYLPFGHIMPSRLWLALAGSGRYSAMFRGLSRLSMSRFERALPARGLAVEKRFAFIIRPEVALRAGLPSVGASARRAYPPPAGTYRRRRVLRPA